MSGLRVSPDRFPRHPPTDILLLLRGDLAPGWRRANSGPRRSASPGRCSGTRGRARTAGWESGPRDLARRGRCRSAIINHKPRMPFRVLGLDLIDLAGVCYLLAPEFARASLSRRGRDAQTHGSIDSHGAPAWWDRAPSASRARIARDDTRFRLLERCHGHDVRGARCRAVGGDPSGARVRFGDRASHITGRQAA